MDNKFTGQLFLRDTGVTKNGKKLFIAFGIVGVDELESLTLQNESQYTIKDLELVNPIDMKELARGNSPDGLLREPIWRV